MRKLIQRLKRCVSGINYDAVHHYLPVAVLPALLVFAVMAIHIERLARENARLERKLLTLDTFYTMLLKSQLDEIEARRNP